MHSLSSVNKTRPVWILEWKLVRAVGRHSPSGVEGLPSRGHLFTVRSRSVHACGGWCWMQSQRPKELSLFIGVAGCLSLVCSPAGRWHLAKVTARAWIRRTGRCFRTCPWTPGLLYLPFALVCLKGRRHGLPCPPWGAGRVRERHPHRSQPAPEPVPTLKACAVPTASPRCCERRQTYPTASVYVYLSLMCIAVSFIPYAFCIVLYFYFVYFQRLFSDFGGC